MKHYLLSVLCGMISFSALGKVELPSLICNHMVVEQNSDIRLWGTARAGAEVSVLPSWSVEKTIVRADSKGKWLTIVTTPKGSYTPHTITFDDGDGPVAVEDVLVGEVWMSCGQSNMDIPLNGYTNCMIEGAANDIVTSSENTGVRIFTVPRKQTYEPQDTCGGTWQQCNIANTPYFSAVSYYFAVSLCKGLGVPVGVINAASGGTRVESWMSRESLKDYPDVKLGKYEIDSSYNSWERPMKFYNAMIHSLLNYTISGFIFYQGCSNVGLHEQYVERQTRMVEQWREEWGLGELPFYFTELAPYDYDAPHQDEKAAYLREAQFRSQASIPNSAMIGTNDLVEVYERHNVHPRQKRKVGQRLSYLALNLTYGYKHLNCFGPQYKSMEINNREVTILFDHVEMGLCRNADIEGFEVAGENRVFHPATKVEVHNDCVVVSSEAVSHPIAVRYCFHDFQLGTLIGANELPVIPFRTDNW